MGLESVRATRACWTALPLLLAWPGHAAAQEADGFEAAPAPAQQPAASPVEFSADLVTYDNRADVLTAEGRVRMSRDGNYVAADKVEWDRKTGNVVATGSVVLLSPQGDRVIGNRVVLADSFRDGTIENLLVVLDTGGRIAADRAVRKDNVTTLENAVYSACPVVGETGCPKRPSWSITAAQVIQDPAHNRIRFRGGRLNLFGASLPLLPIFSVSTGNQGGATGALIPDISVSASNGFEVALPYYFRFAPNRDLTVTPHFYTRNVPGLEARFRNLNSLGAFQAGAFVTYGKIAQTDPAAIAPAVDRHDFRAYFEANGKAQFTPEWSLTTSIRAATDKTVTRRYDLTRDDRLRSFINAERITPNAYVSIAGWAFQGLRVDDVQKQIPIAFPAIDARIRLPSRYFGGTIELQANSLAILRIDGQDTQRAFAAAKWEARKLTRWGQEIGLTAYARGDLYHTEDSASTSVAIYRGTDGWHTRAIGAIAADMRWPLVGPLLGGLQRLTPRLQLVITPKTNNLDIPNEDARAVDLEDSNLFALNRFAGYDRWEDSSRITYGAEWSLDRPNWSVEAVIGQSYRLSRRPTIFPDGTGLTDRLSDVVGKTRVRFGRLVDVTHRYRLDKDSLAVRRNEIDLTVGTDQTYAQIGYLRLNRDISSAIEDLRDKEELRFAGRWKFARYWSVFGATVVDLTDAEEDPLTLSDGFQPVRHRLGINYEDECLDLGLSWKRDYERIGDFRKGSTFSLHIAFKGLGR
ncbi:MAG TPA: LPS assembly protein LptD [Sphingomicrobium sp.]|nr:LPS assembly protein LptD [Sphingomicrobium sp.]